MTRGDMKANLKLAEDVKRCLEEGIAFLNPIGVICRFLDNKERGLCRLSVYVSTPS